MIEIELSRVAAELQAIFPALRISSPPRVLGSGFNSVVIEVDGGVVFRIGKNSRAQEGYEVEKNCLAHLAGHIPFFIPNPKWYARSSRHFPFGILGYEKIPGIPLPSSVSPPNESLLAGDIAMFLFALHHIPPKRLQIKAARDPVSTWENRYHKVLPVLQAELTPREFRWVKRWWESLLADPKMQVYNPVIQHGDFWYENMLIDPDSGRLIGVVDWERLSIGDPAQDFATLFHLGKEFARQVIEAYQTGGGELDASFEHRLQRLWEAREFEGLEYAIQYADPVELSDTLQKLRRGPILQNSFVR